MKRKITKINFLTFDLEDWFHILDLPKSTLDMSWDQLPSRVEPALDYFLDMLSRHHISCTFFVLGWVAERYPHLIGKINSSGHEIASHGYGHELIYDLGQERFRQDIRKSKSILEELCGNKVRGYRGPGFSITHKNLWAFDIIAEEGFEYDATLYPGEHGHGGISDLPCEPFNLLTLGEKAITEFPITLRRIGGYRTAFSGGGYFRLFPEFFISNCIRTFNKRGVPVMTYFHPRDLDPETPRLNMPWKRRFKCYVNLSRSYNKLEKMLNAHSFGSIRDWRNSQNDDLPLFSLKDTF